MSLNYDLAAWLGKHADMDEAEAVAVSAKLLPVLTGAVRHAIDGDVTLDDLAPDDDARSVCLLVSFADCVSKIQRGNKS